MQEPVDDRLAFAVESLEDRQLLGLVSLAGIHRQRRSATFAISLRPGSGGRGHGVDATRVLLRYAFRELGLHRVELDVWAYNTRALATYRRVGFVEEGRKRDAAFHDGRWHDEVVMSVLSTDPVVF